jgi:hypothetical protein
MKKITSLLAIGAMALGIQSASAALNYWVNWTGAPGSYPNTMNTPAGTKNYATLATGTLFDPVTNQNISVTYTGEVFNESEFNNPGGTDMFNFPGTYLGSTVTTLPPAGNYITLTGYSGLTNTLTFGSPVTNLLMAVASLGSNELSSTYNFDRTATVVSSGPGQYGSGPLNMSSATTLFGQEGNGMVQFTGTFTTLSWTVPSPEWYSIFNIGITDSAPSAVPEPGQVAASLLLLAGIGGYVWMKRRKTAKPATVPAAA